MDCPQLPEYVFAKRSDRATDDFADTTSLGESAPAIGKTGSVHGQGGTDTLDLRSGKETKHAVVSTKPSTFKAAALSGHRLESFHETCSM